MWYPARISQSRSKMVARRHIGPAKILGPAAFVCGLLVQLLTLPAVAGPALLFDASSGKVLYAEDQDHLWHPASLTKIMTAYVAFQAIRDGKITPETKIVCTEDAAKEPPSKVGLPVGAEMTVELALKALIVKSANDVAVMLAQTIGGNIETFVAQMNATAKRLRMTRTNFVNPNGLPAPEQVTTARDLALLARAVVRDFPEYAELWSMPAFQLGKRRLASHNSLLRTFEGADGLKTGFICDSGFNVVASATRDGKRLMAVVLGEPTGHDRSLRAASLLEHGFQHEGWKSLFDLSPTTLENLPVDANAKAAVSVRETVLSWDCGYRPRARAADRVRTLKSRAARAKTRTKTPKDSQQKADAPAAGESKKTSQSEAKSGKKPPAAAAATAAEKAQVPKNASN